ncbi:DUF6338 family protein [Candidatus Poriferisocius sp.]|uniref:DUF6338 family protein n=1 Tax=Candidatus Poriferisocius sp. TaxID=3101276 RepID=UPI003B5CF777
MSGFDAAALVFVFLFPGVFFTAGFERYRPLHSRRLKDWVLWLAGLSAGCLAVGAWPLHWFFTSYWEDLAAGRTLPWMVYSFPVAYVFLPLIAGRGLGWAAENIRREGQWLETRLAPIVGRWIAAKSDKLVLRVLGPSKSPTAWDHLFDSGQPGLVRCRLRSGRWVGGRYDLADPVASFASEGNASRDIYIGSAVEFDQSNGAVLWKGGSYAWTSGGLYVKADEIETIDFLPLRAAAPPREVKSHAQERPTRPPRRS